MRWGWGGDKPRGEGVTRGGPASAWAPPQCATTPVPTMDADSHGSAGQPGGFWGGAPSWFADGRLLPVSRVGGALVSSSPYTGADPSVSTPNPGTSPPRSGALVSECGTRTRSPRCRHGPRTAGWQEAGSRSTGLGHTTSQWPGGQAKRGAGWGHHVNRAPVWPSQGWVGDARVEGGRPAGVLTVRVEAVPLLPGLRAGSGEQGWG